MPLADLVEESNMDLSVHSRVGGSNVSGRSKAREVTVQCTVQVCVKKLKGLHWKVKEIRDQCAGQRQRPEFLQMQAKKYCSPFFFPLGPSRIQVHQLVPPPPGWICLLSFLADI